mgnify:CR=1 FL=1
MALDNMPVNGFVQKVKAGDKATVEPVKADFNFLHGKFDSVAGHGHTGAAGDGQKIGINGLEQEVMDKMGGVGMLKLYLVEAEVEFTATRVYSLGAEGITWQTPAILDGKAINGPLLYWKMQRLDGFTPILDISYDGINWITGVLAASGSVWVERFGFIKELVFPFYYRVKPNAAECDFCTVNFRLDSCSLECAVL